MTAQTQTQTYIQFLWDSGTSLFATLSYKSQVCIFHKIAGIKHEVLSPGAAARVGPSSARSVLHQTNLPPIDVCTIQLVQSPLHVRVGPKLYHPLICAFLVGIGISHFSCLTHEVLEDKENVATSFCLNR